MKRRTVANPQPYQVDQDRYCLPIPKPRKGGLYFSFPVISTVTGERIPSCQRWQDLGRELVLDDGVWYWDAIDETKL